MIEAAQHGVPHGRLPQLQGPHRFDHRRRDRAAGRRDAVADQAAAVPALASAVESLLLDAELRADLGRKARLRANEFSWEQTASGVYAVLASSAAGRHVSGLISGVEAATTPSPGLQDA